MCLAVPGEIIAIEGGDPLTRSARVSFWGAVKNVCLTLTPHANVGDYVLVHAGFVITVLDKQAARQSLDAIARLDHDLSPTDDKP